MITIDFLRPYIEKLTVNDRLCIFIKENDYLIDSIYINSKTKKYEVYYNIFSIKEIDLENDKYVPYTDYLNENEIYLKTIPFEEWCSIIRKQNYDSFMYFLNNDEEDNNAKTIYEQIKQDQGKYINFMSCGDDNDCYEGFLLTVVSTDEDYYYVYLTKDGQIRQMTCVSDYETREGEEYKNPFSDKEIANLLKETFDKPSSLDAIIYRGKYDIE